MIDSCVNEIMYCVVQRDFAYLFMILCSICEWCGEIDLVLGGFEFVRVGVGVGLEPAELELGAAPASVGFSPKSPLILIGGLFVSSIVPVAL
jgi:hypothetical protein